MEPNAVNQATEHVTTTANTYGPIVLKAVILLVVGYFGIKLILAMLRGTLVRANRVSKILEDFVINIAHKALWILLIMMILPLFGIEVGPLIAGLGVGGFILGFAFQETLGNLASGLMLMLNQPFEKGDFVDAGGKMGEVKDMNIMCTSLSTPDNKKVVVPNKCIWGSPITNFGANGTRRVDLTMGIAYGADIEKAREVVMAAVQAEELVLQEPAPTIEVIEMADSSVNFVVRPWCKSDDYWDTYFRINQVIKQTLDANDIEIPFPQVVMHQASN